MDPALRELVRRGRRAGGETVEAVIRLREPGLEIPGVAIVSRFGTVATCRLPLDAVPAVHAHPDVLSLKAARSFGPPSESAAEAVAPGGPPDGEAGRATGEPAAGWLTGAGVVLGVVGWGFDVDHPNFVTDDGRTRLVALWDQRGGGGTRAPRPYGYGIVHSRAEIDRALAGDDPYGMLDYHPADADRGSGAHDTHTADIAAGNGRAGGPVGVAPEADLVFVHLADRATGGLATLGDSVRLLEAVDFIARAAGERPWVANLSVGQCGGPHNGTLPVERAFDELLAGTPGAFVVQSAGNYALARTHASGWLRPGEARTLTFVTQPTDLTPNELEIWYDGRDEFAVWLQPPDGSPPTAVRLGCDAPVVAGGRTVGWMYHRARDPGKGDHHVDTFLAARAPAGRWRVTLQRISGGHGPFHVWIERDDSCAGCQPRFVATDSNRRCTLGTIATSHLPLVVGAYDQNRPDRPPAAFTSWGPTRDGRSAPHLCAPGVAVLAARSAPRGRTRSPGLLVRKSGTSMAAPRVAGAVALCLQARGHLAATQIRDLVLGSLDVAPGDDRLGRGYLNLSRLTTTLAAGPPGSPDREPKDDAMNDPAGHPATDRADNVDGVDGVLPLALAPATAYRELLYRPDGPLAGWIRDRFDVLGRPGQLLSEGQRDGDVAILVTLGRLGAGVCVSLVGGDLVRRVTNRGHAPAGWYARTAPLLAAGAGARRRRIMDPTGRIPYGLLLLRPRRPDGDVQEDTGTRWSGTPEQLDFRDRVLQAHLALALRRRGAPQRDLRDDELRTISGTAERTALATADAIERLLAAATADLAAAQAAGDADALRTVRLTVNSGYRDSGTQLRLWRAYFADKYYDRTAEARAQIPEGPHSDQAVAYMLAPRPQGFGIGGRIAAPGYSNHQGGVAVDLHQVRTRGNPIHNDSDDASRARWRATWFHHWLREHAERFGFHPLVTEEWHWIFRGAGTPPAAVPGSPAPPATPSPPRPRRRADSGQPAQGESVTEYLGGRLWTFPGVDPGLPVAVFVPRAALGRPDVDVLVFAHGLLGGCRRPRRVPAGFVTDRPFDLGRVVDATNRPVVLVVPALDWTDPGGQHAFGPRHPRWHALGHPRALNALVARALDDVGRVLGGHPPAVRELMIAGHSRAYDVLEPLVHHRHDPAMADGALARLGRIGAFDTTYGGDVDAWLDWLSLNPRLSVQVYYRPGTPTATVGDAFLALRRPRLEVTRVSDEHCDVPAHRLPALLSKRPGPGEEVRDELPDDVPEGVLEGAVEADRPGHAAEDMSLGDAAEDVPPGDAG